SVVVQLSGDRESARRDPPILEEPEKRRRAGTGTPSARPRSRGILAQLEEDPRGTNRRSGQRTEFARCRRVVRKNRLGRTPGALGSAPAAACERRGRVGPQRPR